MEVHLSQLAKVPYLETTRLGERELWLQPFFDGAKWYQWVPTDGGGLTEIQPVDFTMGPYFAVAPACPDKDGQFLFLEFIIKHASFPDVMPFANGSENDLHNLGAALWALDHFFDLEGAAAEGSGRLALTELEYILVLCRSLLDLLQAAIAEYGTAWHWLTRGSRSGSCRRASRTLRSRPMVHARPARSPAKHGLPTPFAEFYARHAPFFSRLRGAREEIVHTGTRELSVDRGPRGFIVHATQAPFSELVP